MSWARLIFPGILCFGWCATVFALQDTFPTKDLAFVSEDQYLETSGARAIELFRMNNRQFLAIPQLAEDIPGADPNMNGGNSDVDSIVFRLHNDQFEVFQRIPGHGGEDIEYFQIEDDHYLAVCGVRSGSGPYNPHSYAVIYHFDGRRFYPVQQIATFAAKQCRHFSIGDRHFIAIANGVVAEGLEGDTRSPILEWRDDRFEPFQLIPTQWAYNWTFFEEKGQSYLLVIDHLEGWALYQWAHSGFEKADELVETGARAMTHVRIDDESFFAYANILGDSRLYRFGENGFEEEQVFAGPGGREFHAFNLCDNSYLVRINFITGPREAPIARQPSQVYRWNGEVFELVQVFQTLGGTDAGTFETSDGTFLAVSNSLSEDIRFRVDSVIYKLNSQLQGHCR